MKLWRIAIKPGKPLAFGVVGDTPFSGLPGNPVSAFVTYCLFVSPFIKSMQGRLEVLPRQLSVRAAFDWPKAGKRQEYLRAKIVLDEEGQSVVDIFSHQGSGVLTSTSWADGLVVIPVGETVRTGDFVNYIPFTEML